MANVWGYWKCPSCGEIVRADNKLCTSCSMPIPKGCKFFMDKSRPIEYVATEQESDLANWVCAYCQSQNSATASKCSQCGASRSESTENYFGMQRHSDDNIQDRGIETQSDSVAQRQGSEHSVSQSESEHIVSRSGSEQKKGYSRRKIVIIASIVLLVIIFAIWFFWPIEHIGFVQSFEWQREIGVEEYTLYHESDWSMPAGAELEQTRREVHHYDTVVDHYETKTRQVPKTVQDGYDITYKDLGNGQFQEIKTPKYKTVYETESYSEAVYGSVPVYRTKYYYTIGRWKEVSKLCTRGEDKEPKWCDTDLPVSVSKPEYGVQRQGRRTEHYYARLVNADGEGIQRVEYTYAEWQALKIEDGITYKTFRFSDTPLYA